MIHMHTHSKYSLRDSIINYEDLITRLKEIGQNTIAITDHGNIHASVSIYKKLTKAGIKYIHGCEMYICDDTKIKDKDNKYYHLVVLCKNETARINLNKLISISNREENFYNKPRIDFNILKQYKEGLIILSACLAGEISTYINNNYNEAYNRALRYKTEFGEDYYLEIQARNDASQIETNKKIISLARELSIPLVVTTDAHFVKLEDKRYHNVYAFNSSYKEEGEGYIDCYIQSEDEIRNNLKYLDDKIINETINNTHIIADKCNVELPLSAPIIPHIDIPSIYSNEKEWLVAICKEGFEKRGINDLSSEIRQTYIDRYNYELNAVEEMGFLGYYLLVYTYANKVKRRGIARGSGGGSLLCYLMNITDIDPIEHKLYFERFIDVGALDLLKEGKITRKELKIPDVDLDFGTHDREIIIQSLVDTYKQEYVACIGRFNYNKSRGTLTDIGRALNIPFEEVKNITKSLGEYELDDIYDLIEQHQGKSNKEKPDIVKKFEKHIDNYPELFEISRKLIGLPSSFGLHPCFTEDAMVLTREGYKYINTITQDDYVLTHNNTYEKVYKTHINISDNVFNIDIMGIPKFNVTANHPLYARKMTYRRINNKINFKEYSEPKWIDVSQLQKGYWIGFAINQENKIPNNMLLPFENEDFWWIIGRYLGDGWYENVKNRNEKRLIICCSKNNN
jgi:DNA polymerase-3 subunit alpha